MKVKKKQVGQTCYLNQLSQGTPIYSCMYVNTVASSAVLQLY